MKHAIRLVFLLAAMIAPVAAMPKAAQVRVTDIYRNLESTELRRQWMNAERAGMLTDERHVKLQETETKLAEMSKQLSRNPAELTPEKLGEFEVLRHEVMSLREYYRKFRETREREINTRVVEEMRISLERIATLARQIGAERGFSLVFDMSGNSNTGLPVVIYAKEAEDLTDAVIAALQDRHGEKMFRDANTSGGGLPELEEP